jgi:hypothetical protein
MIQEEMFIKPSNEIIHFLGDSGLPNCAYELATTTDKYEIRNTTASSNDRV